MLRKEKELLGMYRPGGICYDTYHPMNVTVKLFASFRQYLPDGAENNAFRFELAEDTTVEQLAAALNIPEKIPKLVLVNGRHSLGSRLLAEDDVVSMFPPIGGG